MENLPEQNHESGPPIMKTWTRLYWFVAGFNVVLWTLMYIISRQLAA